MGNLSTVPHLQAKNNDYKNPFGSEIALFRTSEGGMSRMAVCWDMPAAHGEQGRVYGEKTGQGQHQHQKAVPTTGRQRRWSWRVTRSPDERICRRDLKRPQAVGRRGASAQHDSGRYRRSSVSTQ